MINWLLDHVGVDADRLEGEPVRLLGRHLDDGRLAVDRLQRADLPGRHAGHPARPVRVGLDRRRRPVRQFWSITVPLLKPTIIFAVIISTIGGLQLFTEPRLFDSGTARAAPTAQSQTVTMYMFENASRRTTTSATARRSPGCSSRSSRWSRRSTYCSPRRLGGGRAAKEGTLRTRSGVEPTSPDPAASAPPRPPARVASTGPGLLVRLCSRPSCRYSRCTGS